MLDKQAKSDTVQSPLDDPHFQSLVPEVRLNRRGFIAGAIAAGVAVHGAPKENQGRRGLVRLADADPAGDAARTAGRDRQDPRAGAGPVRRRRPGHPARARGALARGPAPFGKDKACPIHVYPDVPHAFHADYRPSYRKPEAEDGWKRMLAWLKKHGVA